MRSNRSLYPSRKPLGIKRDEVRIWLTHVASSRDVLDVRAVARVFHEHGCPRRLAFTIAEQLKRDGHRQTTVLASVNLRLLASDLEMLGVALVYPVVTSEPV